MEKTSARLSPRELFQLKWFLGGILSLVSMWTIPGLGIGGDFLALGAMFLIAMSLLFPRLPGWIPSGIRKAAPSLLLIFIIGDFFYSGADFLPALIRAILLLITLRSLEYRRRRHDLQLVLLAVFIVVISGVLSMELTFALQVLLFTPLAMAILFTVNLSETATPDEKEIPDHPWSGFRWRWFLPRLWGALDRRMVGFSALLFAGMALSATIMFVSLPRFELGQALPFMRLQSQQSFSGFSESVQFGDVVNIIQDNRMALRADINGERPAAPPYWRMLALDVYADRRFQVSESAREANRHFSDHRLQANFGERQTEPGDRWTLYFEPSVARFLPLPGSFTQIRFQSRQDLVFNPWLQTLGLREVPGSVLFYQLDGVSSMERIPATQADRALIARDPEASGLSGERAAWRYPATTLAVPDDEVTARSLQAIVEEISGGEELSPHAFAMEATRWLQERHHYSLASSIPPGEGDPLVRWMLNGDGGHCELFAGALILLARQAGIPARMVTGFHGGDWNGFENYYMVRNANAHAWVELFDGVGYWWRFDPTPASGLPGSGSVDTEAGEGGPYLGNRSFEAYLDSLRILWYRRVVNFDQRQQRELMTGFRHSVRVGFDGIQEAWSGLKARIRSWFSGSWTLERVLHTLPYIAGGALILLLSTLFGRWFMRRIPSAGGRSHHRIRRQAGRWLTRLKPVTPECTAVREALLVIRYDSPENWPEPSSIFEQAARALRESKSRSGKRET